MEKRRLAEAGVNPFVIRDAFAQVQFDQLGWHRQKSVLVTRDWMSDLHFKWTARLQAAEEVLRTHTRIPKTKPTKDHKNEDEVEEVISYRRIRSMFRPFGGLFHLRHFVDAIRANDRFNKTILDLRIGPKGMYMPLEQIEDIRKTYYKQELADTLSLYPNMKLVFMVRDPRR